MDTALFDAVSKNSISLFRAALVEGGNVNSRNENGETPLIVAIKNNSEQLARFIISKGANLGIRDNDGFAAVDYAKNLEDDKLIKLLGESKSKSFVLENQWNNDEDRFFADSAASLFDLYKSLKKIIKGLKLKQLGVFKNDFIKLLLLVTKGEELNDKHKCCYGLLLYLLVEKKKAVEFLLKLKKTNPSYVYEMLLGFYDADIDFVNRFILKGYDYELESFTVVPKGHIDGLKRIMYEYTEIIVKVDGKVTQEESENLKTIASRYLSLSEVGSVVISKPDKGEKAKKNTVKEKKSNLDEVLEELNELVGLDNIKNDIKSLINIININSIRRREGLPEFKSSLHSVFTGAPGTGKTTIARLLAKIYKSLGVLHNDNFVETDRSGLVAGYVGQTAIKTDEVVNKAINGILFIDEAYALKRSTSGNDFGQEAIDVILKRMEDHRDELIVIVAGYGEEMKFFIDSNPGLQSRFSRYFHFEDYSPDELTEIYNRMSKKAGFVVDEAALIKVKDLFSILYSYKDKQFGNARLARNIFEKTFEKHANRTAFIAPITREILTTIKEEDIPYNEFLNAV